MKRVNTTNPLAFSDEDRKAVRSDVGKQLIHEQNQTTTAKQKHKITKKDSLLENQDIKRWYDNLARSSIVTAEVKLRKLGKFCENNKITPMELIDLGLRSTRAVTDLLEDNITTMEKKRNAPQYIKSIITAKGTGNISWHVCIVDACRKLTWAFACRHVYANVSGWSTKTCRQLSVCASI
jgi:hypothetical protein